MGTSISRAKPPEAPDPKTAWDVLPDDIKIAVVSKLPLGDVARIACVCRDLNQISQQDPRWTTLLNTSVSPAQATASAPAAPRQAVGRLIHRAGFWGRGVGRRLSSTDETRPLERILQETKRKQLTGLKRSLSTGFVTPRLVQDIQCALSRAEFKELMSTSIFLD